MSIQVIDGEYHNLEDDNDNNEIEEIEEQIIIPEEQGEIQKEAAVLLVEDGQDMMINSIVKVLNFAFEHQEFAIVKFQQDIMIKTLKENRFFQHIIKQYLTNGIAQVPLWAQGTISMIMLVINTVEFEVIDHGEDEEKEIRLIEDSATD